MIINIKIIVQSWQLRLRATLFQSHFLFDLLKLADLQNVLQPDAIPRVFETRRQRLLCFFEIILGRWRLSILNRACRQFRMGDHLLGYFLIINIAKIVDSCGAISEIERDIVRARY